MTEKLYISISLKVTNYESKSEFRNLNLYNSALKYVAKNLFLFANTIHLIPAPNFRDVLNKVCIYMEFI